MSVETRIIKVKIEQLKETEHNPRQINKDDFEKLKKSLKEFPEMRKLREVIVDENLVILGGHQRVRALQALGENEIEVKQVEGLTEAQKKEFVIKDNVENGDWDFDLLYSAWDDLPLDEWGAPIEMLNAEPFSEDIEQAETVITIKDTDSEKMQNFIKEIQPIVDDYNLKLNIK